MGVAIDYSIIVYFKIKKKKGVCVSFVANIGIKFITKIYMNE